MVNSNFECGYDNSALSVSVKEEEMKVIMLMPCLMLHNNRKANHAAMEYAKQHYPVDEIVVNDAEFLPEDYRED